MKGHRYILTVAILLTMLSLIVTPRLQAAQVTATPSGSTTPSTFESGVVITSPVLVSELHGQVEVLGTANIPNMRNYFLEIRGLNDDASLPPDTVPWIPITAAMPGPVQSDVLVVWDTTTAPDGLYELRLTLTTDNALSVSHVVTPLRINNRQLLRPTCAVAIAFCIPQSPSWFLAILLAFWVSAALALVGITFNWQMGHLVGFRPLW